jgi:hypothetical protein
MFLRLILFILMIFPAMTFASFPVLQINDTIIIDGKRYIDVGVDSLSIYKLPNENIKDYRARLLRNKALITNSPNHQKSVKTPITFWQIIGIIVILWVLILIIATIGFIDSI